MFRKLILWRRNKEFQTFKDAGFSEFAARHSSFINEYEAEEERIDTLVKETKYWHGTGRYQYAKQGTSKYAGVSKKITFDVLAEIIHEGGLKPHYDPWAERYVKTPHSISLANQWGYGKMYAHYHLDENASLQYEIAPISFWYRVIIWIQLTEHYCKFALGFLIWYTFSDALQKQGKVWLSAFRSDTEKRWPFWKILTAQSDIPHNYSILFGVKDCLTPLAIPKILRFMETRTDTLIAFGDITFVAVPYANVREMKQILIERGVPVPVLSLEFLEIYMRQYSLKEIMTQSYRSNTN